MRVEHRARTTARADDPTPQPLSTAFPTEYPTVVPTPEPMQDPGVQEPVLQGPETAPASLDELTLGMEGADATTLLSEPQALLSANTTPQMVYIQRMVDASYDPARFGWFNFDGVLGAPDEDFTTLTMSTGLSACVVYDFRGAVVTVSNGRPISVGLWQQHNSMVEAFEGDSTFV